MRLLPNDRRRMVRRAAPRTALWLAAGALSLIGVPAGSAAPADPCRLGAEHGGHAFPVEGLDSSARCRLASVVNDFTTTEILGPTRTTVSPQLYEQLLDRPVLLAALANRLGLGAYRVVPRGPRGFWVDDGEGTRGVFTFEYRDPTRRIYHVDGSHEGRLFPRVMGKAVLFLSIRPAPVPDGRAGIEAAMVTYTRLNDPVLAGLVRLLRPLVSGVVTRTITKGFSVANHLADLITKEPERIAREVRTLPLLSPEEQATLLALLPTPQLPRSEAAPSAP